MKKYLYILLSSLFFISCSTNNCIKAYIKNEIIENDKKQVISVLTDEKLKVATILTIYIGKKRGKFNTQAKTFNQKNYDYLVNKYKNDTIIEFWNKKECENFKFSKLIKMSEISNYRDSINKLNDKNKVYRYNLSKPILNNKQAFFAMFKTSSLGNVIEDCVIIMKKEKGKWVFIEKVNSSVLH
jgi:hypothetical protein